MLNGQHRGRAENGHLPSVHNRLEGRPHGHFGFSVTDIAAQQPVHRARGFHVPLDLFYGPELVLGLLVDEHLFKFPFPLSSGTIGNALHRLSPGVELQEFLGDFFDGLLNPGPGPGPGLGAEFIKLGSHAGRAGKFLDQVQVLHRNQQPVIVPVDYLNKVVSPTVKVQLFQPIEAAHAVFGVNHVVPLVKVLELGEEQLPRNAADYDFFLGKYIPLSKKEDFLPGEAEPAPKLTLNQVDLLSARAFAGVGDKPGRYIFFPQHRGQPLPLSGIRQEEVTEVALLLPLLQVLEKERDPVFKAGHRLEGKMNPVTTFFPTQLAEVQGAFPDRFQDFRRENLFRRQEKY